MPALQSLRGLAALWVVLYHLNVFLSETPRGILPWPGVRFGWLGVDLFFVLSAYLLGQPFMRGGTPRWGAFVADRFWRIAPAYYVSFVFALGIAVALNRPDLSWANTLPPLVFAPSFSFEQLLSVNPPFWTLVVEMQFYLILPLLAAAFRGRLWPGALAACLATSMLYRAWLYQIGSEQAIVLGTFALPAFFGHFGLGLAIARIGRLQVTKPVGLRRALFAGGLVLVVAPLVVWIPSGSLAFGTESLLGQTLVRPIAACGMALVVLATASGGWMARALAWSPIAWLGAASYSLYLVHLPTELAVTRFIDPGPHRLVYVVVATALSLFAGFALYYAVEAPAERWRHRRKHRLEALAKSGSSA